MASENLATQENDKRRVSGTFRAPQETFTIADFIYGKLLGLGSYSKVIKVKKKGTGQEYALKVMDKRHIVREKKVQFVKMERLILDQLDHPGVTRLHFTFQDNLHLCIHQATPLMDDPNATFIFKAEKAAMTEGSLSRHKISISLTRRVSDMAMECCDGGELFEQIDRKGKLSEEEARFYAAEIVEVLEYIHSESLIHRDLKPENILFTADGHVKIADFGSAKMLRPFTNGILLCDPDETSSNFVGTADYVAPEVLNSQPITPSVDMWALGCVIYKMLEGRTPFEAGSEYLTFQRILSRDLIMSEDVSPDAKDLIEKLLNLVAKKRPSFAAIKKHPFFKDVSWGNLRNMAAPKLALSSDQIDDEWDLGQLRSGLEELELSDGSSESRSASNSQASSPKGNASGELSANSTRKSDSGVSSIVSGVKHTLTEDCTSEQWQRFLRPGEKLLGTSMVRQYDGKGAKRFHLLLTSKPRLAIVDLERMKLKREFPWSNDSNQLYLEAEDNFRFSIRTPKLSWQFGDVRGLAYDWKHLIESLQDSEKTREIDAEKFIAMEDQVQSGQAAMTTGKPVQNLMMLQPQLKRDKWPDKDQVLVDHRDHYPEKQRGLQTFDIQEISEREVFNASNLTQASPSNLPDDETPELTSAQLCVDGQTPVGEHVPVDTQLAQRGGIFGEKFSLRNILRGFEPDSKSGTE